MSDKNDKNTKNKTEELQDSDLDQTAGGNFEEIKVTYKNSGGKGNARQITEKGDDGRVSGLDLGSGR